MEHQTTSTVGDAGFWLTFRERTLHLGSMSRRLRLVTALAIAQVIVAAILLALRGAHVATTPLVGGSLGLTSVSVVVLWLSVGFLVLAWAYLLAGALDAHRAAALLGLAAFGAALVPLFQDVGWHAAPAVVRAVALAGMCAVFVFLRSRGAGIVKFGLLLGLVAIVYATFAWDASSYTVFRQFTFGVADQLMTMSFFLLPVLFLTGAEFSEWAEVAGGRLAAVGERASSLVRMRSAVLLAVLAAAISVAVLIHDLVAYGSQLPLQIVLFALAAAVVIWVARAARPAGGWPHSIPWAAMALVACAFIGILLVEVYRSVNVPQERLAASDRTVGGVLHAYRHDVSPRFQLNVPENWEVLRLQNADATGQRTLIGFSGRSTANPANFFVSSVPARLLQGSAQLLPIFLQHFYGNLHPASRAAGVSHGWRQSTFDLGPRLQGVGWERTIGRLRWAVLGWSNRKVFSLNRPLFGYMWQSFSTRVTPVGAPAEGSSEDPYRYNPVLVVRC